MSSCRFVSCSVGCRDKGAAAGSTQQGAQSKGIWVRSGCTLGAAGAQGAERRAQGQGPKAQGNLGRFGRGGKILVAEKGYGLHPIYGGDTQLQRIVRWSYVLTHIQMG
ncbi:hypothetical protein SLEP1_g2598 [Rubroshorea leprosula]|uniref:Uncharacterized protein n=1 Tax=Rubroshorea leprosula TaxID=152421 RepID=A0AAV5HTG3_9ROSI|nr:hypothetical protein SLEP1_g2598 [Rubroshorea leprosula]